ncbi:cytochrome P450 [Sistotremastrum niveocremeum HHB9708]|uniref:Cytochrome P450 n=1 Tax=Sistotremastrum niveocremeum HHB9708 TaxID=1314777 RepID=A0A164XEG0_9AGAM|nr:cytochrome P450 [Sistotremastrum niveocremeum HHB9708]
MFYWENINPPWLIITSLIAVLGALFTPSWTAVFRRKAVLPTVRSRWPWQSIPRALEADPDRFFAETTRKHGPAFAVHANGRKMIYVTNATLIAAIYKNSKSFVMSPLQGLWAKNCFGFPNRMLSSPVLGDIMASMHRDLSPKVVSSLLQSLASEGCSIIDARVLPPAGKHQGLLPFILDLAFDASTRSVFGPGMAALSPAFREAFWAFDTNLPRVAFGCPPQKVPGFEKHREYLVTEIISTLKDEKHHEGSELASSCISLGVNGGWSDSDIARILLGILWPLLANAPNAIFWLFALQLQHPDGLKPLVDEIDRAWELWRKKNPGANNYVDFAKDLPELPLLKSAIDETLRYASSSYSMRQVHEEGGTAIGSYFLQPGEQVVCVTRSVHLDENIYDDPLRYDPNRFLTHTGSPTVPSHAHMPFGGGISICEGRHYAVGKIRILTVLILLEFVIELDGRSPSTVKFAPDNRGFGMIRPDGDLNVKIRRRSRPAESQK